MGRLPTREAVAYGSFCLSGTSRPPRSAPEGASESRSVRFRCRITIPIPGCFVKALLPWKNPQEKHRKSLTHEQDTRLGRPLRQEELPLRLPFRGGVPSHDPRHAAGPRTTPLRGLPRFAAPLGSVLCHFRDDRFLPGSSRLRFGRAGGSRQASEPETFPFRVSLRSSAPLDLSCSGLREEKKPPARLRRVPGLAHGLLGQLQPGE
jgi:hypothetical protein